MNSSHTRPAKAGPYHFTITPIKNIKTWRAEKLKADEEDAHRRYCLVHRRAVEACLRPVSRTLVVSAPTKTLIDEIWFRIKRRFKALWRCAFPQN